MQKSPSVPEFYFLEIFEMLAYEISHPVFKKKTTTTADVGHFVTSWATLQGNAREEQWRGRERDRERERERERRERERGRGNCMVFQWY